MGRGRARIVYSIEPDPEEDGRLAVFERSGPTVQVRGHFDSWEEGRARIVELQRQRQLPAIPKAKPKPFGVRLKQGGPRTGYVGRRFVEYID
jgi:hypothetical protein